MTRILILSASIGEGHDGPARALAAGVTELDPTAEVRTVDFLAVAGPIVRRVLLGGSSFHSRIGSMLYDAEYWLAMHVAATNRLGKRLLYLLSHRRVERLIAATRPAVVVSTYPGASEVLGELRSRGRLDVQAVSAITDLAALDYWAHPGIDLHLITHPESHAEVRDRAPASEIEWVRGLTSAGFDRPRDGDAARRDLGLPEEGKIVAVSGGGWAVGDLAGAAESALAANVAAVVCLCGRNEDVRLELAERFAADPRVRVMGFTDRISDVFAASDVLVHSTAGLTVLEALIRGCRVISYGWGHGHIRVNNQAFLEHGLGDVAATRSDLQRALWSALGNPATPDRSFESLPLAAGPVLSLTAPASRGLTPR